jgi:hypothetical protein
VQPEVGSRTDGDRVADGESGRVRRVELAARDCQELCVTGVI